MLSSAGWLAIVLGSLAVVITVALLGVWQFGSGLDQKAAFAARNPRSEADRAARRPLAVLDRMLRRTRSGKYVHRRLTSAGSSMRTSTFVGLLVLATGTTVGLAWHYLAPFFGVASILLIVYVFFRFLRQMEERRREEFVGQLPELARVLSNAFSAGLALRTAIDVAAEELDDPARAELRTTADSLKLGQSTEDALEELGERLPSRELSVLVSTLVISARAGGSMVTALRNISTTLESRKEVRREVKTVLSQAVATSYVVIAMGVGALLIVNVAVPGGLRVLTANPSGIAIVVVSAALFALGLVMVRRMAKVDV